MVGTAIVAAASALASVAGGIAKTASARRQQRLLQKQIDDERAKNDAWYNRRYNEDFLQRTENQSALTRAKEALMRSSRAAAGTSAVQGTSNAVAAAQKEANNQSYADLVSNVAANASKERDAVESQYRSRDAQIDSKQSEVTKAKYDAQQAAIDTAVTGVQGAANAYLASHQPASSSAGESSAPAAKKSLTPLSSSAEINTTPPVEFTAPTQQFGSDYVGANGKTGAENLDAAFKGNLARIKEEDSKPQGYWERILGMRKQK